MAERIEDVERLPGVRNLTGYPAVGAVAPEGTYWRGWLDLRGKAERVLIYCAATRGGEVYWLDGVVAGGSGDWLIERDETLAEAVRATARESLR
jgi:hypothetical protein